MSDAYERERQNNAFLESLSQKTNALKSVTIDIYDNARNQETIDNTVRSSPALSPPSLLTCFYLTAILLIRGGSAERSILVTIHEHQKQRGPLDPCRKAR
ncbi:predicted protein [Uncinocarpus reesii 1704]|uniref:Uncharacterized protein n=1 Tax=Uncinocarpus reesii (strain UAMH 1704) TaxID=336963 RepID=C4JGJ3_UNCRE|nr:uncharacterized protein UREG_01184 [Uncinocarpus reesii 1704]EEP76335.1 predicted protein [Uncinocarpus reesii 1704]